MGGEIKYLLENGDERKRLSEGALKTAGENSIENMSENILGMYYEKASASDFYQVELLRITTGITNYKF